MRIRSRSGWHSQGPILLGRSSAPDSSPSLPHCRVPVMDRSIEQVRQQVKTACFRTQVRSGHRQEEPLEFFRTHAFLAVGIGKALFERTGDDDESRSIQGF